VPWGQIPLFTKRAFLVHAQMTIMKYYEMSVRIVQCRRQHGTTTSTLPGCWSTRGQTKSRTTESWTGQFRGLDNSRTGQFADWSIRGQDESWTLWSIRGQVNSRIMRSTGALVNYWLTRAYWGKIANCRTIGRLVNWVIDSLVNAIASLALLRRSRWLF